MNGLSNLQHIVKQTGTGKCDQTRPECNSKSNGMIFLTKSQGFGESIRNWKKGDMKPCLICLNNAHAQGRIGDKTYAKGLEIRGRA